MRVDQLWELVFPPPPYPPPRGTDKETQNQAQDEPKTRPEKSPNSSNVLRDLLTFFLGGYLASFGPLPRVVASAPEGGPKMAQDGPKMAQDGPRRAQDDPKMRPTRLKTPFKIIKNAWENQYVC